MWYIKRACETQLKMCFIKKSIAFNILENVLITLKLNL